MRITGILIMMNNYLHDVATAVLAVSAAMLFVFARLAEKRGETSPGAAEFFLDAYRKLRLIIIASLVWIVAGGVVRTLAYMKYEWLPAAGRGQVPALIIKHIMIFTALALGVAFWMKLKKTVGKMEAAARNARGGNDKL